MAGLNKEIWAYGILFPDGRVVTDQDFDTEEEAWTIALGWPDEDQIAEAKADGARAVWCQIRTM